MTRLEAFLRSRRIRPSDLAREANLARQHLARVRLGETEPRRKIIAAVVSALRRMTLEPIQADDVFELTTEESGAWQSTRGVLLEERLTRDQAAAEYVRKQCLGASDERWLSVLTIRPDLVGESLLRVLILAAREAIDDDPARAAALAHFAITVADHAGSRGDSFLLHLRGCAGVQHGNALRHLGTYEESLSALDESESDLLEHVTSANDLAQAWYVRGTTLWKMGTFAEARRTTKRAAVLFAILGDDRRVAYAHVLEASIAFEQGDPALARTFLLRVLEPLKRVKDARGLAAAWLCLGTAEGQLGNMREAKRWFAMAAREFERLRVKPEMIRARWSLGYFLAIHEDRTKGIDIVRLAQREFESAHMPMEAGFVALDLAEVLLLSPEGAEEAEQVCRKLFALFQKAGVRPAAEKALAYLRETAAVRHANADLVKSVRSYLRELERDSAAEFPPLKLAMQ